MALWMLRMRLQVEARNLQQFRKCVRVRLLQHSADKARPEFWYAERSGFAEYLVRRDAQHLGAAEYLHDFRIIWRDRLRIDSGKVNNYIVLILRDLDMSGICIRIYGMHHMTLR